MNKKNKVRSGIFAIAMVLLCNPLVFAQSGTSGATGAAVRTNPYDKHPAATALQNYKEDASNPELSSAQLSLLKAKAALEAGLAGNTLSPEEIAGYNQRIATYEAKVTMVLSKDPKVREQAEREQARQQYAQKANAAEILNAKQITRSEFTSLDIAGQKQIFINNVTVTDLVNADASNTRVLQDNVFYIPVADFKGYDMEKQIHILNNPSNYIVVQDASAIPVNKTVKQDPAINTNKISRAELNSFSPERRKAIEESKNIEITD